MKLILLISVSLIATIFIPIQVSAVEPIYARSKNRIAIRGYDVVSYFTDNTPIKGSKTYSYEYKGAKWFFSSKRNLELFKSNPEKYEPQYGGYCAYAAAKSNTAASKPQYFTIYNEKLYLNFGQDVNDKWLRNKDEYIRQADQNWPSVLEQ